jgi:hypothetical protein
VPNAKTERLRSVERTLAMISMPTAFAREVAASGWSQTSLRQRCATASCGINLQTVPVVRLLQQKLLLVNVSLQRARRAISRVVIPAFFSLTQSRTWRIDILSIGIGTPLLGKAKRADPKQAGRGASPRAISDRNRGRDHLGMVGDFISESGAI